MVENIKQQLIKAQKNEITEYYVYNKLADSMNDENNKKVLRKIASDEKSHHDFWQTKTNQKVNPNQFKIWRYYLISRLLGLTFGIKLMEKGEENAQINYNEIAKTIPEAAQISAAEHEHEQELIQMINEQKLKYVGSIVLGLNDALVELTGALAGFTLALQNSKLIAMTGLITGLAASFSMAASEYLATKSEGGEKEPLKASIYTGVAYVLVVTFLILPFLLLSNLYLSLGLTLIVAVLVIFFFTFYTSVAQDLPFKKRFLEMAAISLSVAVLTFGIGYLIRIFFGIEI
ncbi:MAG: rubrerythrin family protein [Candidatus Buchananbacteria bacterium RIFCSPHIGHO2_01_FULL_39_8]|uniref:Rubrerythrin family protein n=1 Tax=Candidatus Buchananbacteria bacterium RIFCSPHIGHO2_01_FULL_39_8 TaxID=1797533 RepID=A0A1G1Y060_9BACT|nr:MAG: rubrerythrin family protein [Candidatus Buchananbacteria bacterium RIFCSPHIGHO2_01_FULL_39_8]